MTVEQLMEQLQRLVRDSQGVARASVVITLGPQRTARVTDAVRVSRPTGDLVELRIELT